MNYVKLQVGCLIVLLYVIIIYVKETTTKKIACNHYFDLLLYIAPWAIVFDGVTAWTVNHQDIVPANVNLILHLLFFLFENAALCASFLYMHDITIGLPQKGKRRIFLLLPFIISSIFIIGFINELHYIPGKITNYSMGLSVYACYISMIVHFGMILIITISNHRTIAKGKKISLYFCLALVFLCILAQVIWPEILISALFPVLMVVSFYINFEDPYISNLEHQKEHMVDGFATIVENRDDSTGGHIKRTRRYVRILMDEMSKTPKYRKLISKDYYQQVCEAAPLHDIGKVSTPDSILQKPGKLTDEEYAIMKEHSKVGGEIIRDTFCDMEDPTFVNIAYEVARYHHERWDGKGYPDGLSGEAIPLHARVMAVADVFDAVSEKRCYRDALPIDECFKIIEEGAGTQFDPDIVKLFLKARPKLLNHNGHRQIRQLHSHK